MAKKISGSVGKGGKNKSPDTQAVQELLNAFSKKCGFKKLDTDGLIGPKTISAIAAFQKSAMGMSRADSRVDPGGKSFTTLSMGPKKAEAEAKKAEKADQGKEGGDDAKQDKKAKGKAKGGDKQADSAQNGKPQVKGATRGIDKKILAVLEAVSAHYGKPIVIETGKQKAAAIGDAKELWQKWRSDLDSGKRDPNLSRNEKLRKELDAHYSHKKFDEFLKLVAKSSKKSKGGGSDAHATGRAVDIKRNTDQKMVAALATILRREDEENVIHFDDTGKSVPKTITEAMKRKWK